MAIIGQTLCPLCHGSGERRDGARCAECGGTGVIPVNDDGGDRSRQPARE